MENFIKGDIIAPNIRAWRHDFRHQVNISILKQVVGIEAAFVEKMTYKEIGPNISPPAIMTLGPANAQTLMDDLWECGVRPSEGTGSAGSLKATQNHLGDIKKILFHTLRIDKPK